MTLSRLELGFESPWGRQAQVRYCRMQCRIFCFLCAKDAKGFRKKVCILFCLMNDQAFCRFVTLCRVFEWAFDAYDWAVLSC